MDMKLRHRVDTEDLEALTDLPPAPPGLVRCQECTILIGPGHLELEPFSYPARHGVVCRACLESLERRARRHPTRWRAPQALGAAARRQQPRTDTRTAVARRKRRRPTARPGAVAS